MTLEIGVEEYFELEERDPDTRYEYLDGYMYIMPGGSANHATIGGNIRDILKGLLRGGPCRAYNSDMKVRVSENRYLYPDVVVSCDARDRGNSDLIRSPRVVVEVLSPSTEARDRGRKLQAYLACPTIEEYLLVDYRTMRIEIYRKEQKKWMYDAFGADDEVELASLGVHFPVADAYEDVIFENGGPVNPQAK
ncbi:MAG TPA: Uma2 family endonuclease [Ktedonobacteraceae bacterium]|nr:Uma2 family endonuclease [Ktedonobacteraceae bacterium]